MLPFIPQARTKEKKKNLDPFQIPFKSGSGPKCSIMKHKLLRDVNLLKSWLTPLLLTESSPPQYSSGPDIEENAAGFSEHIENPQRTLRMFSSCTLCCLYREISSAFVVVVVWEVFVVLFWLFVD